MRVRVRVCVRMSMGVQFFLFMSLLRLSHFQSNHEGQSLRSCSTDSSEGRATEASLHIGPWPIFHE